MAKGSDTKLYVALGVLAVLGGALYFQMESKKEIEAEHSYEGMNADLPALELTEEKLETATKIVIDKPAKEGKDGEEGEPAQTNVLVKAGEEWKLEKPVDYPANGSNVESLIKNLAKLEIKERIAKGKDSYANYDLTDEKALHVTVMAGDEKIAELWFGQGGGRGQTMRLADEEGVYAVDGYSAFLYGRDTTAWRDKVITEVDPETVTKVSVENENGSFEFKRAGGEDDDKSWDGEFKKDGSPIFRDIEEFEASKVDDLLRAYKKLNASDFADNMSLEEAGLAEPEAKLTLSTAEGDDVTILFGGASEGSSRWVKLADEDQIYSVSSWAAGWATAEPKKFQKAEEGEEEEGAGAPPMMPSGMPPGMPQLPAGHP